jgi:NAD(P)-dependent dehydrogenase (short-subunit alcohol dehydrogenase family)
MQLKGKSALITGGGRGIGKGIALAYAREGAKVAIVGRSRSEPEEVAAEIQALGSKGVVITADLTQSSEAQRAVREAVQDLGKVDILVNNVGGYRLYTNNLVHHLPVAELSEEEWHRVISGNLTTTFLSCKAVYPT